MPAQQPGALLAQGRSWLCCSLFLASLQLCPVTMENKAWPPGSVALGTKFRCITTACPRCLPSPLYQGQHFPRPSTPALETGLLSARDRAARGHFSAFTWLWGVGMGWEGWKRLGDGGRVSWCCARTSLRTGSIPSCLRSSNLPSFSIL